MTLPLKVSKDLSESRWVLFGETISVNDLCYFVSVNELGSQGVNLAYLQTGISGVFFWVLNFKNLYFLGTGHSCRIFGGLLNKSCILKCFIFSTVLFGSSFIHQVLQ